MTDETDMSGDEYGEIDLTGEPDVDELGTGGYQGPAVPEVLPGDPATLDSYFDPLQGVPHDAPIVAPEGMDPLVQPTDVPVIEVKPWTVTDPSTLPDPGPIVDEPAPVPVSGPLRSERWREPHRPVPDAGCSDGAPRLGL